MSEKSRVLAANSEFYRAKSRPAGRISPAEPNNLPVFVSFLTFLSLAMRYTIIMTAALTTLIACRISRADDGAAPEARLVRTPPIANVLY